MITECPSCQTPLLFVGKFIAGTACPECRQQINTLTEHPIMPLDNLIGVRKRTGRPKGAMGQPSWLDDIREILYDDIYNFGMDGTSWPAYILYSQADLSIVNHTDVWADKKENIISESKPRGPRHQRMLASGPRAIARYKKKLCRDCNRIFWPVGAVDRRCPDCKTLYQEAYRIKHNQDVVRRRLSKRFGQEDHTPGHNF